MEKKTLDTKLEMLLMSKTFEQLTIEEKGYALNFLSEEEYNECAFILSGSKAALLSDHNNLQPSPKILAAIEQAFKDKATVKKPSYAVIFTKPLYQSLMAAALLIIIISLFIVSPFGVGKQHISKNEAKQYPIKNRNTDNLKKEALIAQTSSVSTQISKPTAKIKIARNNSPIHNNRKMAINTGTSKNTYNSNLCLDTSTTSARLVAIDSSTLIPCLNTRLIIPESNIPAFQQER
jgi:hypothetical protein